MNTSVNVLLDLSNFLSFQAGGEVHKAHAIPDGDPAEPEHSAAHRRVRPGGALLEEESSGV